MLKRLEGTPLSDAITALQSDIEEAFTKVVDKVIGDDKALSASFCTAWTNGTSILSLRNAFRHALALARSHVLLESVSAVVSTRFGAKHTWRVGAHDAANLPGGLITHPRSTAVRATSTAVRATTAVRFRPAPVIFAPRPRASAEK